MAANVFGTMTTGGTEILISNHNVNIIGYPTLTANTLMVSGANTDRVFYLIHGRIGRMFTFVGMLPTLLN